MGVFFPRGGIPISELQYQAAAPKHKSRWNEAVTLMYKCNLYMSGWWRLKLMMSTKKHKKVTSEIRWNGLKWAMLWIKWLYKSDAPTVILVSTLQHRYSLHQNGTRYDKVQASGFWRQDQNLINYLWHIFSISWASVFLDNLETLYRKGCIHLGTARNPWSSSACKVGQIHLYPIQQHSWKKHHWGASSSKRLEFRYPRAIYI